MTNHQVPAFQPLTGIYEPSAIQQLPDGRFLVVEDEKSHPFSLVTIGADGSVNSTELTAGLLQMFSGFWKLDDLEGMALDRAGFVYGITSHSRDGGRNSTVNSWVITVPSGAQRDRANAASSCALFMDERPFKSR